LELGHKDVEVHLVLYEGRELEDRFFLFVRNSETGKKDIFECLPIIAVRLSVLLVDQGVGNRDSP
jgi:hypothetical protein